MPNEYFRFKQFTIHQDRCAMKVTTDACIFGAWVPVPIGAKRMLDVGSGTGLLSLMMAQRFPELQIDAVEIDEASATQAAENFAASPFAERLCVVHGDVREMLFHRKYDLVVSNPPFFSKSLQSDDKRKMDVRHDNTLRMDDLLAVAADALHQDGQAAVLWPVAENRQWWERAQAKAFYLRDELCIHPAADGRPTRTASTYARAPERAAVGHHEVLSIAGSDGGYTARCTELLRPFYLKL